MTTPDETVGPCLDLYLRRRKELESLEEAIDSASSRPDDISTQDVDMTRAVLRRAQDQLRELLLVVADRIATCSLTESHRIEWGSTRRDTVRRNSAITLHVSARRRGRPVVFGHIEVYSGEGSALAVCWSWAHDASNRDRVRAGALQFCDQSWRTVEDDDLDEQGVPSVWTELAVEKGRAFQVIAEEAVQWMDTMITPNIEQLQRVIE